MNAILDLIGRILLSVMFLQAGLGKITGYAGMQGYMESQGVPGMLLPAVIALEIAAPIALIVGWQTRWAALALGVFTLLAAVLFHLHFDDQMQAILFMKNVAIAGGLAVLAAHAPGRLGIDGRRSG